MKRREDEMRKGERKARRRQDRRREERGVGRKEGKRKCDILEVIFCKVSSEAHCYIITPSPLTSSHPLPVSIGNVEAEHATK